MISAIVMLTRMGHITAFHLQVVWDIMQLPGIAANVHMLLRLPYANLLAVNATCVTE